METEGEPPIHVTVEALRLTSPEVNPVTPLLKVTENWTEPEVGSACPVFLARVQTGLPPGSVKLISTLGKASLVSVPPGVTSVLLAGSLVRLNVISGSSTRRILPGNVMRADSTNGLVLSKA